mgnify:CR=1 FL=1
MVKQMKPVFETTQLEHHFSDPELLDLSKKNASAVHERNALEEQKKQIVNEFKAKLDHQESLVNLTSQKISNGYEYRDYKCLLLIFRPKASEKDLYREHVDGEPIGRPSKTLPMTQSDFQTRMKGVEA